MKRAAPFVLFALALAVQELAARALITVDLVDQLMVQHSMKFAVIALALLGARFFAIFVGPGWVIASLIVRRARGR